MDLSPYLPGLVGQDAPESVLGKHAGAASVKIWLERLGRPEQSDETVLQLVNMVKTRAYEKNALLDVRDFENILAKAGI